MSNKAIAIIIGTVFLLTISVVAIFALTQQDESDTTRQGSTQPNNEERSDFPTGDPMLEGDQINNDDMPLPDPIIQIGQYTDYDSALLSDGVNVIFFHASWCPTCRQLDNNIKNSEGEIPAGTIILRADYDSETSLRREYGVTTQHTLVQVDNSGNMIKKWTGSYSIDDILAEIN